MVSHSEGILRDLCQAGLWLHQGQAHWFDDIDEAIKAYHDSLKLDGKAQAANAPPLTERFKVLQGKHKTLQSKYAKLQEQYRTLKSGLESNKTP